MSNINEVGAGDFLSQLGPKPEQTEDKSNELGQNEFLELMIAQMNNQSPLDPQDNAQFVAELAQFSSVESLEQLNTTVDSLASQFRSSQALQASAMVGRDVMVEGTTAVMSDASGVSAILDLPGATAELKVRVLDNSGSVVHEENLGSSNGGDVDFFWAGTDNSGEAYPPGRYEIVAEARYDGKLQQVNSFVAANVDSVSIAGDGSVTLNLSGMPSVSIEEIKEIQ